MEQCYIQIKNSIQKQFKYRKGFKLNILHGSCLFNMCTHTCTLRMICLGRKRLTMPKGKMKNKKLPVGFLIVGNHVHITYKAIAKCVQGSKVCGANSWGSQTGIAKLSI